MSGANSDACQLGAEEERILTSFTRRLLEIAAVASARGPVTLATSLLNSMRLPAIALDRRGFVVDVNTAATVVFDDDGVVQTLTGRSHAQVTSASDTAETTVKAHVSEILRKLNVYSRTKAAIEVGKMDFAQFAAGFGDDASGGVKGSS